VRGGDLPQVGAPVGVDGGYLAARGESGRDDARAAGIREPGGECDGVSVGRLAVPLPVECVPAAWAV
jgi:hypothetical protein